ncbi:MAG TPA: VIT1/CCC1 transporter family protein [Acidimicrobiales bacterium]|nr:VIT1/CCC1 transporter family protein [Acidimicrobiales bacterium]
MRASSASPRAGHQRRKSEPFFEHHHRNINGGAARAAVFGVSDGLQTNVALILGVAGAHPAAGVVRLAGLAGLIGGSFSMASGEYISMRAQRELLERELDIEREAIATKPELERRELAAVYRSKGVDDETANSMATQIMVDPEVALETHAREELGVNPGSLGSPLAAAASSFGSFGVGAFMPLLPWLIGHGNGALVASLVLAGLVAVLVVVGLSRFTGKPWIISAARQLLIAGVAASVTFGVGRAIGG